MSQVHTQTVNLHLSTSIRAVLSKEWLAELIEQAKIVPPKKGEDANGGDVFLHTVYRSCHLIDGKTVGPEFGGVLDHELFARTVFANGIRKVLGNSLAHFIYTAGGVAGTVSPAKCVFTEVPAAERAKLLRLETDKPVENRPLLPQVTAQFVPKETDMKES